MLATLRKDVRFPSKHSKLLHALYTCTSTNVRRTLSWKMVFMGMPSPDVRNHPEDVFSCTLVRKRNGFGPYWARCLDVRSQMSE